MRIITLCQQQQQPKPNYNRTTEISAVVCRSNQGQSPLEILNGFCVCVCVLCSRNCEWKTVSEVWIKMGLKIDFNCEREMKNASAIISLFISLAKWRRRRPALFCFCPFDVVTRECDVNIRRMLCRAHDSSSRSHEIGKSAWWSSQRVNEWVWATNEIDLNFKPRRHRHHHRRVILTWSFMAEQQFLSHYHSHSHTERCDGACRLIVSGAAFMSKWILRDSKMLLVHVCTECECADTYVMCVCADYYYFSLSISWDRMHCTTFTHSAFFLLHVQWIPLQ